MEPISPVEEVFVCQTCGDVGFTNAFVYCVKCLNFVIHRYCLLVMPKTLTELVIWYCEHCKPTEVTSPGVQCPNNKKEAVSSGTDHNTKQNKERGIDSLIAKAENVISHPMPKKNIENNAQPIIETIWSENSSLDSDSSSSSSNLTEFDEWEARVFQQNQRIDTIINDMILNYPDLILGDDLPRARKRYHDIASIIAETKEVVCHHIPKKNFTNGQKSAACLAAEKKEHNDSQLPNFENNLQDNYYRCAQPIIDPVWRGSFSVGGRDYDDVFEGFVGHLSNKACVKVCEEANMLPSLLHLEMHTKTLLWPKSFNNSDPSDDQIGLYFFPGDPINERGFDELVLDMMDGGLAMRATAKNAELLIFTSAVLPPLLRRFRGKYYLWGIFRAKRNGPTSDVGVQQG